MKRSGLLACLGVLFLPAFCSAAVVHVSTRLNGPSSVLVGGSTSITVLARIDQPLGPDDGIFTFDLDLLLNKLGGTGQVLSVTDITRPNVNDTLIPGSNGTPGQNGVAAIHGGYLDQTRGVGQPTELFTVTLKGLGEGSAQITPGPAVDPFGFDFVLYLTPSGNTTVTYDSGVRVDVVVPEPAACAIASLGVMFLTSTRRSRMAAQRLS